LKTPFADQIPTQQRSMMQASMDYDAFYEARVARFTDERKIFNKYMALVRLGKERESP
jgi:hypothetical protein